MVRQDVNSYNIIIIKSKFEVRLNESKHGKIYNGYVVDSFYYYYYSSYPDVYICELASLHTYIYI